MPQRLRLRRRPASRRHIAVAVVVACSLLGLAAGLSAGRVAVVPPGIAAHAQVCVSPLLNCGTPTASGSGTAKPPSSQPGSGNPKPPPPTSGSRTTPRPTGSFQPVVVPPGATPLPTLPPPTPGAPPEPPELEVQSISLQLASAPPARPGGIALIQGTLEAQRGTDTYSVPHAVVTLSVTSSPGRGANVIPSELDSGDTGIIVVTVVVGDEPGDTVVHAQSGNASADVTVHTDAAPAGTATAHPGGAVAAASGTNPPGSDSRRYLIAALAALIVALFAGYAAAPRLGRFPNPFQRRSVWGRRSGTSQR